MRDEDMSPELRAEVEGLRKIGQNFRGGSAERAQTLLRQLTTAKALTNVKAGDMVARLVEPIKPAEPPVTLTSEYREAVAKYVQSGRLAKAKAGQYFVEGVTPEFQKRAPVYDVAAIKAKHPKILEIGLLEQPNEDDDGSHFIAELRSVGGEFRVELGPELPPTTNDLLALIDNYYRNESKHVVENLKRMGEVFDGFDDD